MLIVMNMDLVIGNCYLMFVWLVVVHSLTVQQHINIVFASGGHGDICLWSSHWLYIQATLQRNKDHVTLARCQKHPNYIKVSSTVSATRVCTNAISDDYGHLAS